MSEMTKSEAGNFVGKLLAPVISLGSRLRQARLLHPNGVVCQAWVEAKTANPVAARLAGPALVRLSGALWKEAETWDVLGLAVRFAGRNDPLGAGDQDLLFATIQRPWTMGLALLTTDPHDYLSNDYNAVSPMASELGRVELRLRPVRPAPQGKTRADRLESAISDGNARFVLEWAPYRKPWQLLDESRFEPLVEIKLTKIADVDQAALKFDPFRDGRGFSPTGFVQSIRRAVYAASQAARPAASKAAVISLAKPAAVPVEQSASA